MGKIGPQVNRFDLGAIEIAEGVVVYHVWREQTNGNTELTGRHFVGDEEVFVEKIGDKPLGSDMKGPHYWNKGHQNPCKLEDARQIFEGILSPYELVQRRLRMSLAEIRGNGYNGVILNHLTEEVDTRPSGDGRSWVLAELGGRWKEMFLCRCSQLEKVASE